MLQSQLIHRGARTRSGHAHRVAGNEKWEEKKRFSAQHLSTMAVDGFSPYKDNQSMKFRIDFIFHAHKQSSKKRNEMQNKHLMKYLQLT